MKKKLTKKESHRVYEDKRKSLKEIIRNSKYLEKFKQITNDNYENGD